ncbi:MAG: hypothetical protein U9N49_06970, partial [Campylobacterota bacterium]|nr:hypothetical protein [Campylobacterota bacterium]
FLLPGVELSVNDGANGIHTLVIFNPNEWLENGNNFIQHFITESFAGQHNFENENGRSNDNLIRTIEKLNKYHRGYFITLAHVEDRSGFFNELNGGRVQEFGSNPLFREYILGFQKVRSRDDVAKWKQWLKNELPAFVEGSDPKKIEEIGKGEKSYIKIGDYNFEAVKFALQNHELRVKKEKPKIQNAYIKSITFDGGKLDKQSIEFANSMNNFVGIRGSGKSSIIEGLRYILNIPYGNNSADVEYKNTLVKNLFGSAGKAIIKVCDREGREFTIDRVYGHSMQVKRDNEPINLNINSILNNPIYFGQKDLSNYKENFKKELIAKLIGAKTNIIKEKIDAKKQEIKIELEKLKQFDTLQEKKEQVEQKIVELKLNIDEFKKHSIEARLKKQIEFDKDSTNFANIVKDLQGFRDDVDNFLSNYKDGNFFEGLQHYQSKENEDIFASLYQVLNNSKKSFIDISTQLNELIESFKSINTIDASFKEKHQKFKDEFLKIQREINLPDNLRADDFIRYTKNLDMKQRMLKEIDKSFMSKRDIEKRVDTKLSELNELYRDEYKIIEEEIQKINKSQKPITIKCEFKGDKKGFEEYLKKLLGGSGLSAKDYQHLTQYADGVEIYRNIEDIEFGG